MINKIKAWLKLSSAPQVGYGKLLRLVKSLGSPEDILENKKDLLGDISFLSSQAVSYLKNGEDPPGWKRQIDIIEKLKINFCSILDEEYPSSLKQIAEAPPFLFYLGSFSEDDFRRSLAVVGTRKPSEYGKIQCIKICRELVEKGFTLVSGLAYGIDALAHKTALGNKGRTIAVLGSSLDQIYPASHHLLAEKIADNGALITEQVPGSSINRWNFVDRNRIISGLSCATWVVEAGLKSGALITARNARQQNRMVFSLPADINRESSQGTNSLIAEGAKPVLNSKSILQGLGISGDSRQNDSSRLTGLNEMEKHIWNILTADSIEIDVDRLHILSGIPISQLSTLLLSLELKGLVKKGAGNKIYPIR